MIYSLAGIALLCLTGFAAWFPNAAVVLWIIVLETSPDIWLDRIIGGHETIIAALKTAGLAIAVLLALRFGARWDRYNPGFAFAAMFGAGLLHGLYPGLTFIASCRSLLGSTAPFAFGFARLAPSWRAAVIRAIMIGPSITVAFGAVLTAAGLGTLGDVEQGAIRLGGSGEAPFLAGYALIAIYAGLMEWVRAGRMPDAAWLILNFIILLFTGARAPLALASVLTAGTLLCQRRLFPLAGCGALLCLALIFSGAFSFVRVVDLTQLGEAADLSNRDLIWPFFEAAWEKSPWIGWGVGAGKVVVPVTSSLHALIGTNAAHDEYLRVGTEGGALGLALLIGFMAAWVARGSRPLPPPERWMMRAIFVAFAIHSATDNTLIATTSSVFFIWVSTVFASAAEAVKAPP